jgi:hypothetical protein
MAVTAPGKLRREIPPLQLIGRSAGDSDRPGEAPRMAILIEVEAELDRGLWEPPGSD